MIIFWIAAALLSAATASLIVFRAMRAVSKAEMAGSDPALAVYRRQLAEIDELSERGLIPQEEQRSARAEAARRLLAVADLPIAADLSPNGGRRWTMIVAGGAPLIAVSFYLAVGSPTFPDQPFAQRAAAWRKSDPSRLNPAQMAVVLETIARERPNDAAPLYYLGRAQAAAGDPFSAEHSLRQALTVAPRRADIWVLLGEVLAEEAGNQPSADARKAFEQALALDPTAPEALYVLGRMTIASGDVKGGLARLNTLLAELPADDPRRSALAVEIAAVEKSGKVSPETSAAAAPKAADAGQQAFIQAMVDRLAARLAANPDDPAGWGRLIRSYQVLGDAPHSAAAAARAQQLFKGRPDALRTLAAATAGTQ